MASIKSIINMHNKEVITEKKTEAVKCNCINKLDCPLSNQYQITNVIQNCNWNRTQNHLVRKRTLNYLAKLAK